MNAIQSAQYDEKAFASWFCAHKDIPEDVDPFDVTDEGMFVWKETRDGLAQWLEMQKSDTPA